MNSFADLSAKSTFFGMKMPIGIFQLKLKMIPRDKCAINFLIPRLKTLVDEHNTVAILREEDKTRIYRKERKTIKV